MPSSPRVKEHKTAPSARGNRLAPRDASATPSSSRVKEHQTAPSAKGTRLAAHDSSASLSSARVKKRKSSLERKTTSGTILSSTHVEEHESAPSATSNLAAVGAVLSGIYAVVLESTGTLPLMSMAASSTSILLDIMVLQFDWRHVPKGSLLVAVNHAEWPDSPEHVGTLVRNLRLLARDATLHFETSEKTAVNTYGVVPAKVAPSPRPVETIASATTTAIARMRKRRAPLSDPTVGPHENLVQRALMRECADAPETSTRELAELRTALAASLLD